MGIIDNEIAKGKKQKGDKKISPHIDGALIILEYLKQALKSQLMIKEETKLKWQT